MHEAENEPCADETERERGKCLAPGRARGAKIGLVERVVLTLADRSREHRVLAMCEVTECGVVRRLGSPDILKEVFDRPSGLQA